MKKTSMTVAASFLVAFASASQAQVAGQQPAKTPARSQQRIPIKKDTRRVDTLRITVVRVDTIRITDTTTVYLPAESPFTAMLTKTDTLRDSTRCGWVPIPIPIPIPFSHTEGHANPAPPIAVAATVTPEPATWALVATGLVGVGIVARRKR
jgi:hypothetical protein